jgi:hypothetical protein
MRISQQHCKNDNCAGQSCLLTTLQARGGLLFQATSRAHTNNTQHQQWVFHVSMKQSKSLTSGKQTIEQH